MNIEDLSKFGIPISAIELFKKKGFLKLYPPQEIAIEKGVLDFKNLILTSPTASGKTFVALLACIKHLSKNGKVLYICPLRALASEKYEEFKELLQEYKIALSVGDYDSEDPWLANYDVIISTYEKADSLLRHRARWISDVTLFIIDEIHMIDSDRGPTLEFLIARLRKQFKHAQFIALSATVKNAKEIADWLQAELAISNWRPVPLKEGVYRNGIIYYKDLSTKKIPIRSGIAAIDLTLDVLDEGGQSLIFNSTRAGAVRNAERLKEYVARYVFKYREDLKDVAEKIEENDRLSLLLKDLIINGVAFHHAGLSFKTRRLIEQAFRDSLIKVVSSTTTLGAGINVPARRVIINEISRYSAGLGYSEVMSLNEYKQLAGRAGRPRYDNYGEAIIIARGKYDVEILMENYLKRDSDPVDSEIREEKSLRSHLLSLIANEIVSDREELIAVLNETFASRQIGMLFLERLSERVLAYLSKASFIVIKDKFVATPLGKRVSELYIDPLSAEIIVKGLKRLAKVNDYDEMYYLFLISSTEDMQRLTISRNEMENFYDELKSYKKDLPLLYEAEDEETISTFKTAKMLYDWINEVKEDEIADKYGIGIGDIYSVVQNAEWLCHSAKEIAKLLGYDEAKELEILEERIENGVKEELLELVKIPMVGRTRARILYNAGYRSMEKLARAKESEIIALTMIGPETYRSIKEYLRKINMISEHD